MSKAKILITEDEAITAMSLKKSLTDMGYTVVGVFPDGESAIESVEELQPDLVLMDIQLAGEMDGISASENIRLRHNIPVVFLTAYADNRYIEEARITQPFGYLLKPVREQELHTTIEMALYRYQKEREIRIREETIRVLMNRTHDLHYLIDTEGKIVAANEVLAKKAGSSTEILAGKPIYDCVAKGLLSPKMAGWKLSPLQKKCVALEEEFRGAWYRTVIHPISDPDGKVILYAIHVHDITESRTMQEQLRQNNEYFRSLLENWSDIIVILNKDGTIRNDSPSFQKATGLTAEQVAGKKFFDFLETKSSDTAKQLFMDVMTSSYKVRPFTLHIRPGPGQDITFSGIISNLSENPVIEGIVLNGWIIARTDSR